VGLFAQFDTSEGSFTIRLFDQEAPQTVANFVGLAEGTKPWKDPRTNQTVTKPYYDGVIFHRVIDGFMIQGGDPLGEGIGGPGYTFADEFHPKLRHNKAGILSMANRGPDTNGGQFFTLAPTPHPTIGTRVREARHGRRPRNRQRRPTSAIVPSRRSSSAIKVERRQG
jgi:peptidyl-prolyl cis-trans isomerase A (cyclophilin A)